MPLAGGGVLQVEAAAEATPFAGHHDHADAAVVVCVGECLAELPQHLDTDRVHAIGPVQTQGCDVVLLLVDEVAHDGSPRVSAAFVMIGTSRSFDFTSSKTRSSSRQNDVTYVSPGKATPAKRAW